MNFILIAVALFSAEGGYGLGLLVAGHSWWGVSGPLIVQGFGCAVALSYWYVTDAMEKQRRKRQRKSYGDLFREIMELHEIQCKEATRQHYEMLAQCYAKSAPPLARARHSDFG